MLWTYAKLPILGQYKILVLPYAYFHISSNISFNKYRKKKGRMKSQNKILKKWRIS